MLFVGQGDIQPDRFGIGVESPPIRRLHDSRSAPGDDHIVAVLIHLALRRNNSRELPRVVVVVRFCEDSFGPFEVPLERLAWSKLIAGAAWTLAALTTLGLFDATVEFLDGLAIAFGGVRISVLTVVKGVFALAVLMWVAFSVSRVLEARIRKAPNLTPSIQVLMGKLTKIVLITIALLIALESVGIDLTALTVFGGMLGVGIGFGMQKIVSNFVSGLILLMDKSIAPGDVIAVGETYGWIVSLGARYASVRTRDGTEHLIPNEEIITQRVENWSHSDRAVRFKIPVGISYGSDVRLAIKLCLEAANEVGRVLKDPETKCLLKGFGDSSVDLEIRIWVNDPENGRSNIKSEVLLGVWDRFHENNIEIPFPQRDLHVKSCDVPAFLAN